MKITVGKSSVDGMIEVAVNYFEQVNNLGFSVQVTIWVAETDSRKEIRATAIAAARHQLQRCLTAHDSTETM